MSIKEAQEWLEKQVVKIDWGYDAQLSAENIQQLLAGKVEDVEEELWELNIGYIWEREREALREAAEEFEVDVDDLDPVMGVDLDLKQLAGQTQRPFGVDLGIEHIHPYQDYNDVEAELEALGLNPHDIDEDWPDCPGRDPLITTKALWELWHNCCYSGDYIALLDSGEVLESLLEGKKPNTLESGANLTIYNFWCGAGSMIEQTIRDVKVDPGEIYDDGKLKHGVQSCYGLGNSSWNGILKEEKP